MKQVTAKLAGLTLAAVSLFAFAACKPETEKPPQGDDTVYTVVAPDGAPALALVNAIEEGDEMFDFSVVDSSTIQTYVTGENPSADFCILPINAASKLIGTGEVYQMVGTVTNGNLYFLSAEQNDDLTAGNLSTLIGKSVGVVQLPNVPGLTLQVVLNKYDIPYAIVGNDEETSADKVNLIAFDAANVTPAGGCDYYLCPEPAASTKVKGTASAAKPFRIAGDLQALYGDENGYPQAVLVAKRTVLESGTEAVETLVSYLKESENYLSSVAPETVLTALDGVRTEGLAASFNANNLTNTVIANCSVRFTAASACKDTVNAFLEELIAVNATAASAVSDDFYYIA